MNKNRSKIEISQTLEDHCAKVVINDSFRHELQDKTRKIVAGQRRESRFRQLRLRLAGLTAVFILLCFAYSISHNRNTMRPITDIKISELLAVTSIRGNVTDISGKALKLGDRVAAGTVVQTGSDGRVSLVTRNGSLLHLASGSILSLDRNGNASVSKGRLYCSNRNHDVKIIETPAGKIKLLGTVLDAEVLKKDSVAVTVVQGKVELINSLGRSLISAGKRSVLMASALPDEGNSVNVTKETAWYDGRGKTVSEFGEIAYTVTRPNSWVSEIWAMNADGTGKHKIMSYLGFINSPGPWMPGNQWLSVEMYSALWTTPDMSKRTASAGAGHPIIEENPSYLLNAASAQDMIFGLPKGYDPLYPAISPDGRYMAFTGSYKKDETIKEGGLWVFDSVTGDINKLLDGWIKTPPAWSPDGKHVTVSEGEGYGTNHHLALIDIGTGEIERFNMQGAGPVISPDGTKIAYCGDFKQDGSWYRGVPTSGSIFVVGTGAGSVPIRLSPEGEGSIEPCWSPDGTWIMYNTRQIDWNKKNIRGELLEHYQIYVAKADGSITKQVYKAEGRLLSANWSDDGNSIFVRTSNAVQVVSPDGSGLIRDLGGSASDSILSAEERLQTEDANKYIEEAIFQYALGNIKIFEGKPRAARDAFMSAARIFTELPWRYPMAKLSVINMQAYADSANEKALESDDEYLAYSCKERLSFLNGPFGGYLVTEERTNNGMVFPPDLKSVIKFATKNGGGANWLFFKRDPKHSKMMLECPGTSKRGPVPYTYNPVNASKMKKGDAIVTCPNHPDNKLIADWYFMKR